MSTSDASKQFAAQGFNKRAWHDSNLLTSLRNVSEEETSWRPQAAYRKYRDYIFISKIIIKYFN